MVLATTATARREELRRVEIDLDGVKTFGYFHNFVHVPGIGLKVIIEGEDGDIYYCEYQIVKFVIEFKNEYK